MVGRAHDHGLSRLRRGWLSRPLVRVRVRVRVRIRIRVRVGVRVRVRVRPPRRARLDLRRKAKGSTSKLVKGVGW